MVKNPLRNKTGQVILWAALVLLIFIRVGIHTRSIIPPTQALHQYHCCLHDYTAHSSIGCLIPSDFPNLLDLDEYYDSVLLNNLSLSYPNLSFMKNHRNLNITSGRCVRRTSRYNSNLMLLLEAGSKIDVPSWSLVTLVLTTLTFVFCTCCHQIRGT